MPQPPSAGILLFRERDGAVEVLLIKPGGPFWRNRDEGAWMIPKGAIEPGETPADAAIREFEEEIANRYSFSVRKRMLRRWYYRLADWLTRDLADWHYNFAILDWREGKYDEAATRWEITFCLDPNRDDADYWYYQAQRALAKRDQNNPQLTS